MMNIFTGIFNTHVGDTQESIEFKIEPEGSNIKVTLTLDPSNDSGTEDMIGVVFTLGNDDLIEELGLTITNIDSPSKNTDFLIGQNIITPGGNTLGFNVSGNGLSPFYDVAIKFGLPGSPQQEPRVNTASFEITGDTNLVPYITQLFSNTQWYVRLQSTDGGSGSAKTLGSIGNLGDLDPQSITSVALNKTTTAKSIFEELGLVGPDDDLQDIDARPAQNNEIIWTYTLTNTGNVAISIADIRIVDDNGTPDDDSDDFVFEFSNPNSIITLPENFVDVSLDPGETWVFEAKGGAIASSIGEDGQLIPYENIATVFIGDDIFSTFDDSSYIGVNPDISINKVTTATNVFGDSVTGDNLQNIRVGSEVTWTYTISNTGNVTLDNLLIVDDNGTPSDVSDDFSNANGLPMITISERWALVDGDLVEDSTPDTFDPGDVWVYTAIGTAQEGLYTNNAEVKGDYIVGDYSFTVSDENDSSYTGYIPGLGKTPGFWRQEHHYEFWPDEYKPADLFGTVFGAGGDLLFSAGRRGGSNKLGDAIQAAGGGVNALARAATAALLNAASHGEPVKGDTINYIIDEVFLPSDAVDILKAIDEVYGGTSLGVIEPVEVIGAVKDVLGGATTINGVGVSVNQLATAFDLMNNLPG